MCRVLASIHLALKFLLFKLGNCKQAAGCSSMGWLFSIRCLSPSFPLSIPDYQQAPPTFSAQTDTHRRTSHRHKEKNRPMGNSPHKTTTNTKHQANCGHYGNEKNKRKVRAGWVDLGVKQKEGKKKSEN